MPKKGKDKNNLVLGEIRAKTRNFSESKFSGKKKFKNAGEKHRKTQKNTKKAFAPPQTLAVSPARGTPAGSEEIPKQKYQQHLPQKNCGDLGNMPDRFHEWQNHCRGRHAADAPGSLPPEGGRIGSPPAPDWRRAAWLRGCGPRSGCGLWGCDGTGRWDRDQWGASEAWRTFVSVLTIGGDSHHKLTQRDSSSLTCSFLQRPLMFHEYFSKIWILQTLLKLDSLRFVDSCV